MSARRLQSTMDALDGPLSAPAPAPGADTETITTITASTTLTLPRHPVPPTPAQLNPRSRPTEFLGPVGVGVITLLCPLMAYALFIGCNESVGCPPPVSVWGDIGALGLTPLSGFGAGKEGWAGLVARCMDPVAWALYGAWYAYMVVCWYVLPGDWIDGNLLRDGTRRRYKINAFSTLLLTTGLSLGILALPGGAELYSSLYDRWLGLLTAAQVMALVQAGWVYWWSFRSGELLSLGANSGVFIYDFFLGRPLNPVLPSPPFPESLAALDIKFFNELRPGMILWLVLNISCAAEQAIRQGKGGLGDVDASMWLVFIGEGYYIFDSLFYEPVIRDQMDITTDGFGFMLAFGDLVWVPFTYGLQARYLAFHPVKLGVTGTVAIALVSAIGAYIFRVSNTEKSEFRAGKNPKNLKYMETASGSKLLTSGWWGRSRHPNYFGDWLNAWAWCLPCGFASPIPYFYVVYFAVLLVHRQFRDDEACHKKYGKDWEEYCKKVPYRIIPYVY